MIPKDPRGAAIDAALDRRGLFVVFKNCRSDRQLRRRLNRMVTRGELIIDHETQYSIFYARSKTGSALAAAPPETT